MIYSLRVLRNARQLHSATEPLERLDGKFRSSLVHGLQELALAVARDVDRRALRADIIKMRSVCGSRRATSHVSRAPAASGWSGLPVSTLKTATQKERPGLRRRFEYDIAATFTASKAPPAKAGRKATAGA